MKIKRRVVLAGLLTAQAAPAVHAQGKNAGVALVIGNSKYQWEAQLPNVRRDAPDVARRLQALGLGTTLVEDASRDAMQKAIDKFGTDARGANLSAFYFAGHGAQWERDTYLVPVDTDLSNSSVVPTLVKVPAIVDALEGASHRLLILDNCRNNPADGWRQKEAQFSATIKSTRGKGFPPETLVLYSTAPGRVALDGPAGQNSPFAAALIRQLEQPSVDLQTLPGALRRDLLIATQGRQILWDQSSVHESMTLAGKPGGAAAARPPAGQIVELPNAYAYSGQNKLAIPRGIVGFRPAGGSAENAKVGAFKYISPPNVPALLIVISVEAHQTAELVLASYAPGRESGGLGWKFLTGTFQGEQLETTGSENRHLFKWNNADGGSLSIFSSRKNQIYNTSFTRLDG